MEMEDMTTVGHVVGIGVDTTLVVVVVEVSEEEVDVEVAMVDPALTTSRMVLVEDIMTMPLCHHRDEVCHLHVT
jgi:high-affinity nickel permease